MLAVVPALGLLPAPSPSHAQPPAKIPRVGIMGDTTGPQWQTFRQRVTDLGWIEGQSVAMEWRWSEGRPARFPDLAGELVRLQVGVIVTEGGPATVAAKLTYGLTNAISQTGSLAAAGVLVAYRRITDDR